MTDQETTFSAFDSICVRTGLFFVKKSWDQEEHFFAPWEALSL